MTAQIKDKLIYSGEAFSILRIEGKGLFNPANYGIKTVVLSSACGQGFHCTYQILKWFFATSRSLSDIRIFREKKN